MPDLTLAQIATAIIAAGAVVAVVAGWWRWWRPVVRQARGDARAMRDAILGRDPVTDSITGKELAPALPGIGVRMEHQERQMETLTQAVRTIADTQVTVAAIQQEVADHRGRIRRLEEATVERVVSRAESAAAWRAMEAAANGDQTDELP